ncbi:MAG: GH39 family glycosyl hydrolase [Bryobacteraceae bacterium]
MKLAVLAFLVVFAGCSFAQQFDVQWDQVERVSKTTATLQVVVNPPLRRGSPIHDRVFDELERLGADYVRYVPWLPYPKLAVAELEPPANGKTSWDFSLIDPMTIDFLNATKGHPVMLNFSTIPQWMFQTAEPIPYPADPNEVTWNYTQGTELRDPSGKELGDYYARLVSWYVKGGFTDEYGRRHESGHRFKIAYWEVLNEPDFEHQTTPQQYTARYDAIVAAIRRVAPEIKFVGISAAEPSGNPRMFEYFLDPRNHRPGIPLDMISYHFYATPPADESPAVQQFTFFDQADRFVSTVRYIEAIRQRLSPSTETTVNEIGSILAGDPNLKTAIPDSYWNLSGACYAYVFGHLAELGIDVAGESQLVGYPTQFPSVSMVDWSTGAPNARFRVLELLKNNFHPGDRIVKTSSGSPAVYALRMISPHGERKLLLVNKRDRDIELTLGGHASEMQYVDQTTKGGASGRQAMSANRVTLRGLGVAVVTMAAE